MENSLKLPIGFVGKVKSDNTQNVPKGTKFKVLDYVDHTSYYKYIVQFYPLGTYKNRNKNGPFLRNDDIQFSKVEKILYGKV